jgi:hypothetical protein
VVAADRDELVVPSLRTDQLGKVAKEIERLIHALATAEASAID